MSSNASTTMSLDEPITAATPVLSSEAMSLDEPIAVATTIKLISKDGQEFVVDRKHAIMSELITASLAADVTATELPMPGVPGKILAKVVEFMQHHKGVEPPVIEKPLRSKELKELCKDPWDAEFIDAIGEDRQFLYDVILASNYMDIKSLLHLGCAKVASLIKGQPLEHIKDILAGLKGGTTAAAAAAAAASSSSSAAASSSGAVAAAAPAAIKA